MISYIFVIIDTKLTDYQIIIHPVPSNMETKTESKVFLEADQEVEQKQDFRTYPFKYDWSELETKYDYLKKSLTPNMNKINFVVTHSPCSDGFMSSTIVRMWLRQRCVDLDTIVFYNASYGRDFSKLPEMMKDKYVVICDFSFTKSLFDQMVAATNGNILILDHHKTAQENLQDIDSKYLVFDMNHSGAFITWTYFFGFTSIPKAVLYVEDNDIWNKALPQTREFTAYMYGQDFDFAEYEKFFSDQYLIETAFPTGAGMVLRDDSIIEQLAKKCIVNFMEINGRYYFVACLNSAGILRSELGNRVLLLLKNANFSMIYAHDQYSGSTSISYRSLGDRSDCTEIARLNGGGGHRNASGAGIPFKVESPPGRVIDPYRSYYVLDGLYTSTINGKTYLVLNTPSTGKHLVKYLMQERFVGKEGLVLNAPRTEKKLPGYQEGLFCMRNRCNDQSLDEVYSGAIAWSYDGLKKRYNVVAKFLPAVLNVESLTAVAKSTEAAGSDSLVTFVDLKNNLYKMSFPLAMIDQFDAAMYDKFIL